MIKMLECFLEIRPLLNVQSRNEEGSLVELRGYKRRNLKRIKLRKTYTHANQWWSILNSVCVCKLNTRLTIVCLLNYL